ncbi:MAG: T9SS type A sorting domain-containing protein [Bacteroidia bacterium]|nr:T9SS type A sorting domain-containing protein [Bacteroidia bacterium]
MWRDMSFLQVLCGLSLLWAQTILTSEPTLEVCGSPQTFQVSVSNNTSATLSGVQLAVQMPPGVLYQAGSVTAPANFVSALPPNQPVFALPDLAPGQSVSFTYQAYAACDVIPFLADQNNEIKNTYTLTWSGGGSYTYTPSYQYNILYGSLQYTSITNQTHTVPVAPTTFTRVFTVTNAGNAPIPPFHHIETSGANLVITGATGATILSHTPHALTLQLGALNPGQSVSFTVSYSVEACNDLGSNFTLEWGCHNQVCQTVTTTGGVSVAASGQTPNITTGSFSPNGNAIIFIDEKSCYGDQPGNGSRVLFRAANIGTGTAYQVEVTLFISEFPSSLYNPTMIARIDTGSLTVRIGANGSPLPRQIVSAEAGSSTGCFGVSNVVRKLTLRAPNLSPNDTLYIEFDHYLCDISACHGYSRPNIRSIGWEVSYRGACNEPYSTSGGSNYRAQFNAPLTNVHPGTVNNNQTFDLCVTLGEEPGNYTEWFANPWYINSGGSPSTPDYRFEWIFTLPPGVTYTGGPINWIGTQWNNPSIQLTWPATSVSVVGNTVTVVFTHNSRPAGWQTAWPTGSFKNSFVCLPLVLNCGTAGSFTITSQVLFNPNPTCNPNGFCYGMPQTTTINLNCPVACPQGLLMTNFTFRRTSYGEPDNDNNGVPDGGGTLDMTKIRTDRMMITDTATAYFEAQVQGGPWQSAWAILELGSEGDRFTPVGAYVRIRKAGGGPVYQGQVPLLSSTLCGTWPDCNRFAVDLRDASLISAGIVPGGFVWTSGDSVRVWLQVRATDNPGGFLGPVNAVPYLYTTNNADPLSADLSPHPPNQRFACGSWGATMELVGYFFHTTDPELFEPVGCDTLLLYLRHYLSIGPCCSNYCSGNVFPFEYRLWSLPSQIEVTLPAGWRYVPGSGYLDHQRTQGNPSGTAATCTNQTISPGSAEPLSPNSSPLVFQVSNLFTANGGGPHVGSDDGMFGILFFKVVPSCAVLPDIDLPVSYTVHFNGRLSGSITSPIPPGGVRIRYRGPRLTIQAVTNPVTATQNVVEWYVKVSNISNVAAAPHAFLFFQTQHSNLTVTQVIDGSTNTPISPSGGYYPIGTINPGSDRYFYVRAQILSCTPVDTLWVRVGWDCAGYPSNLTTYACLASAPRDTLTYTPTQALIQITSTVTPNPAELCDTHTVIVTLTNAGSGYGYNPFLYFIMPPGMNLVPSSFEASYPMGSPWVPIAAPQSFFSLRYWNLPTQIAALATGMPHAPAPDNTLQIRFRVATTCNYISGGQISFFTVFQNVCNQVSYQIAASPVVSLTNVIVPYATNITAPNLTLYGCQSVHTYTISILNLGAGNTTVNDSVRVTIPAGVFITGSTVAIQNFTAHAPQISTSGGNTILTWGLQAGHGPGTSMSFSFQFQIDPSLPSGTYPISIQTVINATRACGNTTCNVFYPTGTQNATITLIRPAGLWTGEVSSDWFNPNNWGDCELPTCTKDVVIPDTINDPVIDGGVAHCRDITIEPGAALTITGTGQLDICRNYWLQAGATLIAHPNSHIRFTGPANHQTYRRNGSGDPYHVTMAQGAVGYRLILLTPLEFDGTLTLTQGVIDGYTHGHETYARTPSASVVTMGNASSYVSGVLRRRLNVSVPDGWYYLPVGHHPSGKGYQRAEVQFSAAPTATHIVAQFLPWPGVPPSCVVQNDCGASFGTLPNLDNGYWIIERVGGAVPPYHLRLFATNYTNASGTGYAVVKRPTGSPGLFGFEGVCEGSPYDQAHQTGRLQVPDFSEFAIAQSPSPLAVQFIYVRALGKSNSIELRYAIRQDWSQAAQHEIERSEDGLSWERLETLNPAQYVQREGEIGQYKWEDLTPRRDKTYFYRIRAIERTGATYLSSVVEARLSEAGTLNATLYPNPSDGEAWLELSESGHSVRIWDAAGKLVWEGFAAEERVALPASQLSAGVYVVEVGGARLRWVKR